MQGIGSIDVRVVSLQVVFLEGLIVVQAKEKIANNRRRMNISGFKS